MRRARWSRAGPGMSLPAGSAPGAERPKRPESVAHLLRKVPSLTGDEADALAAALGDLPVAITAVAGHYERIR